MKRFALLGILLCFTACDPNTGHTQVDAGSQEPVVPVAVHEKLNVGESCETDSQCESSWCRHDKCYSGPVNEMPISTFKAAMGPDDSSFVVLAKLSDYYNYEFGAFGPFSKRNYYSFRICDVDQANIFGGHIMCKSEGELHTYAEKKWSQPVFDALKDGQYHMMKVWLSYPSSKQSSDITLLHGYGDPSEKGYGN